ncbi:hypothetical protein OH76DRAFT_1487994 [Lentinus brumalis]|uniref:Uncharacterized protein n=1 Tax=Lentinus brumalis TaxID=2498619 RepID=A0A371CSN5_9APHY|nr:hypothetical protein OH76DRAFT_1487994 [Polyporus brumalis]
MACAKLRATHLKLGQRVLFWLKTRGPLLAEPVDEGRKTENDGKLEGGGDEVHIKVESDEETLRQRLLASPFRSSAATAQPPKSRMVTAQPTKSRMVTAQPTKSRVATAPSTKPRKVTARMSCSPRDPPPPHDLLLGLGRMSTSNGPPRKRVKVSKRTRKQSPEAGPSRQADRSD